MREHEARVHAVANIIVLQADVAQLVEHHLAKVRVAGSNPVVRSKKGQVAADFVKR
jgi:hypothetical protein